MTFGDVCVGTHVREFCTVSQRWNSRDHPDHDGFQLKAIKDHLRRNPTIKYIWYDFACLAQHPRSKEEDQEFKTMLPEIDKLYLGTSVLILLDLTYMSRFWTMYQTWLAMVTPRPEGVVPSEGEERRYTVVPLGNASELLAKERAHTADGEEKTDAYCGGAAQFEIEHGNGWGECLWLKSWIGLAYGQ